MTLKELLSPVKALKTLSFATESLILTWKEIASLFGLNQDIYTNPLHKPLAKPVTAILIGAGHRGNIYADYAFIRPDEVKMVGIADPNAVRNGRFARKHDLPAENRFYNWEDVFKREKFADAVIIATPDNLHFEPCIKALEMGYDVLLEKPAAPTEEQCRIILETAKRTGRIVSVCHVLRYSPYFRQLKQILEAKTIGEIISVQHLEPIEYVHMTHSYVRGNWRNSKTTSPIILAKSCHDTDILRWLINEPAQHVQCFGGLSWFKAANAPEGSTERCIDGCAVEGECPFSALQIYYRDKKRLYVFDLPDDTRKWNKIILRNLKKTNYGKCVYRMDNDQPDHLTVNMQFDKNITASFSMEAFTSYEGRCTRIMGTKGDIVGNMETYTVTDFKTGRETSWSLKTDYHGGGDHRLMQDWVQAVGHQNAQILSSTIDVSVESHLMAFAAEKSRLNKTIEPVILGV
ncbi:Gfo/Idh/MocA family oxidoreductase [Panacibacter ginsenosidivorans]|uniref:Gfo/Idh/MocA family oxidoreductase n=1 Tax=Panacibacter ginsenosidivorans TaxID=1813871 RepID=A0A5B8VC22_9BACT|nr:Gfo/Idh/MocA family oxidoreductase [Panacibacter ginsenosidivorans]QEC68481.1 Gfo/Idh/MocA family oxidoreductase [Panacibacter ginsenosidivorans]